MNCCYDHAGIQHKTVTNYSSVHAEDAGVQCAEPGSKHSIIE